MSKSINIISVLLFFVFGIAYMLKLYMLRKRYNLKANVLANKNKSEKTQLVERTLQIATLVWAVVWFGEAISKRLNINNLFKLWNSNLVNIAGLLAIAAGIIFFCVAAITMKNSWRVGIDKTTKSKLITGGIYKYSRNPAFVGFYLMFIGLFFVYLDLITLIVMMLNIYAMNRLVIEEEKHLEEMFGEEYISYKSKTPRYLLR